MPRKSRATSQPDAGPVRSAVVGAAVERSPDAAPKTSAIQIADIIRRDILDGVLPPGTHLLEEALATQLGTSRTPVRSALASLVQEHLLVYLPNRGYQVPKFSADEILQAYDLRGTLEGMAARLVAERGLSPDGERQMRACLEVVDAILDRKRLHDSDQATWREMNIVFHRAIEEEAHNRFLKETLQVMRNVPLVANALAQWYDYETVSRYHAEHHRIFDALLGRQGARAEALMREHIYQAREFIRLSLARAEPMKSLRGMPVLSG